MEKTLLDKNTRIRAVRIDEEWGVGIQEKRWWGWCTMAAIHPINLIGLTKIQIEQSLLEKAKANKRALWERKRPWLFAERVVEKHGFDKHP